MSKRYPMYAGTEDCIGGTVIGADYDSIKVEKDGRIYTLEVEEEPYWNSMNDCECGGGYGPSHLRAYLEQ